MRGNESIEVSGGEGPASPSIKASTQPIATPANCRANITGKSLGGAAACSQQIETICDRPRCRAKTILVE